MGEEKRFELGGGHLKAFVFDEFLWVVSELMGGRG